MDVDIDHPSWKTLAGTGVGYGAILLLMFVLLFLVPFAVFYVLG